MSIAYCDNCGEIITNTSYAPGQASLCERCERGDVPEPETGELRLPGASPTLNLDPDPYSPSDTMVMSAEDIQMAFESHPDLAPVPPADSAPTPSGSISQLACGLSSNAEVEDSTGFRSESTPQRSDSDPASDRMDDDYSMTSMLKGDELDLFSSDTIARRKSSGDSSPSSLSVVDDETDDDDDFDPADLPGGCDDGLSVFNETLHMTGELSTAARIPEPRTPAPAAPAEQKPPTHAIATQRRSSAPQDMPAAEKPATDAVATSSKRQPPWGSPTPTPDAPDLPGLDQAPWNLDPQPAAPPAHPAPAQPAAMHPETAHPIPASAPAGLSYEEEPGTQMLSLDGPPADSDEMTMPMPSPTPARPAFAPQPETAWSSEATIAIAPTAPPPPAVTPPVSNKPTVLVLGDKWQLACLDCGGKLAVRPVSRRSRISCPRCSGCLRIGADGTYEQVEPPKADPRQLAHVDTGPSPAPAPAPHPEPAASGPTEPAASPLLPPPPMLKELADEMALAGAPAAPPPAVATAKSNTARLNWSLSEKAGSTWRDDARDLVWLAVLTTPLTIGVLLAYGTLPFELGPAISDLGSQIQSTLLDMMARLRGA